MPTFRSASGISSARRRLELLACAALGFAIVVGPELIGGVYPWAMLALAATGLFSLLCAAAGGGLDLRPNLTAWAMLCALFWTIVQGIPLPRAVAQLLVPDSLEALRRSRALLGLGAPAWCAISRDPAGTREEVVKGIAIVCAFMTALALSRHGYRRFIFGLVAASGVAMTLVVYVHAAVGATRVFGLYAPVYPHKQALLAPLLNVNTLGGFLAMCLPVLIGLDLTSRTTRTRVSLLVAIALLAGCTFMTRSRGAVGALIAGPILLAVLALRLRARRSRGQADVRHMIERFGAPVAITLAIAVAAYGWYAEVIREFRGGGWDKLDLIAHGAGFAIRHPWFGIGRGAFGSTFALAHNDTSRFVYAENFVVQWAAEWGLPVTCVLLGAVTRDLLVAARRTSSLDRVGAIVGIAVIAAQNLVDIGLELVGISLVVSALLGAAVAERRSRPSPSPRWFERPAVVGGLAFAVALAMLAARVNADYGWYLRTRLEKSLAQGDRAGFATTLRQALLAHPSEAMFPVLAGNEALRHHDRRVGAWINRAMQLAPRWPGPHLQAAQWLWNRGLPRQAALELSVAASVDPYLSRELLCPMAMADPLGVAAIVAKPPNRKLIMDMIVYCVRDTPLSARKIDAVMMNERPNDPQPWVREARRLLTAGKPELALIAAEAARARAPKQAAEALAVSSDALLVLGRADEALSALRAAEHQAPETAELITHEAALLGQRGDRIGMRAAFERLRGLANGQASEVGRVFVLQAELEERFGDVGLALNAYEQAFRIADDTSALAQIARIAERLGQRRQAAWAYTQLCDLATDDRSACAKRDALLRGNNLAESPANAAQPSQK